MASNGCMGGYHLHEAELNMSEPQTGANSTTTRYAAVVISPHKHKDTEPKTTRKR